MKAQAGLEGIIEEANEDQIRLRLVKSLAWSQPEENCLRWDAHKTNGAVLWEFQQDCEPVAEAM